MILLFSWPRRVACGVLVPRPGIEPVPPALGARSLNHWTARQVPGVIHSKWIDPRSFFLGSAGTAASAQRGSVFPPVHAPAAAQQCPAA